MKKRELRARIAELEAQVERLKLGIPDVVRPIQFVEDKNIPLGVNYIHSPTWVPLAPVDQYKITC